MRELLQNTKGFSAGLKRSHPALLFFLFISGILHTQVENYSFYIFDENKKEPLFQAYVLVKGKTISAISNEQGAVKIKADPKDSLVIYQLGYFLKTIAVKQPEESGNKIYLTRKNITLEEVTITSKKAEIIREKDNTVFIDFAFYDDYLMCLVNKGGKYNSLLLLDENAATLCELPLKIKVEKLFKDCLDNIHLLAEDSIYQIYYDYKRIHLLPPYHIHTYYQYLKPCESYYGGKYIFKEIRYQKLKNNYTYYDLKDSVTKIMSCVADSENIRDFKMDFDIRYFLALRRTGTAYLYPVSEINKYIEKFREELVLDPHYKMLLKPVQSEVKKIDTNFVLFDYTHKEASYFSLSGTLNKKVPISQLTGIYPKIYIDTDARNYLFSDRNLNNGLLTLYRFDQTSNKFSHRHLVRDYYYIKDYKIKGNYLYFINKIRTKDDVKTKIVKIYLDWEKL